MATTESFEEPIKAPHVKATAWDWFRHTEETKRLVILLDAPQASLDKHHPPLSTPEWTTCPFLCPHPKPRDSQTWNPREKRWWRRTSGQDNFWLIQLHSYKPWYFSDTKFYEEYRSPTNQTQDSKSQNHLHNVFQTLNPSPTASVWKPPLFHTVLEQPAHLWRRIP